jgi:hypothetical protein
MIDPGLLAQLDEDELRFVPRHGVFDTEAIARHLATLGFSFRDEADPEMVVVAATEEERDVLQARRRKSPEDGFSYVLLVQLTPDAITVFPSGDAEYAELSAGVIRWLVATDPCRVFNDSEVEVTDALAG